MRIYHISDCKKYSRCPRYFYNDQQQERLPFQRYIRLDEEITNIALQKLNIQDYFLGQRNDDPSRVLEALDQYEWFVKARFAYANLRVKIPILHKTDQGYDIYFLFVGLFPQQNDLFFYKSNLWVLENNGLTINNIYIIHLNAEYVRNGALDAEALFVISDCFYNGKNHPSTNIKAALEGYICSLPTILNEMESLSETDLEPPMRSTKCVGRQKCRFYYDCFEEEASLPDNSILHLIAAANKYAMHEEGCVCLRDADLERIEGTRQQFAQIQADKNGGLFVDKQALQTWFQPIQYPITFLDFEWERFAIPPYDGMHPYDVLPFEFSYHVLYEDGHIDHDVFLAIHDDREDFVKALLQTIPPSGSIVAYNAIGAEMIRLQELSEQFPSYASQLNALNERMIDMQVPFVSGTVYDVRMKGQWSLKAIMVCMDDDGYQDLDIAQGMDAVFGWRLLDQEEDTVDKEKMIADLKAYCAMDTYAMVVIFRWLRNLL